MRSDTAVETDAATELTDINADDGAGVGNYAATTDSLEAQKDATKDANIVKLLGETLASVAVDNNRNVGY